MAKEIQITGYCMKTKETTVMHDVIISKTSNGRFFAKGTDGTKAKNKICVAMGEAKALEAIKAGVAKKGDGWK